METRLSEHAMRKTEVSSWSPEFVVAQLTDPRIIVNAVLPHAEALRAGKELVVGVPEFLVSENIAAMMVWVRLRGLVNNTADALRLAYLATSDDQVISMFRSSILLMGRIPPIDVRSEVVVAGDQINPVTAEIHTDTLAVIANPFLNALMLPNSPFVEQALAEMREYEASGIVDAIQFTDWIVAYEEVDRLLREENISPRRVHVLPLAAGGREVIQASFALLGNLYKPEAYLSEHARRFRTIVEGVRDYVVDFIAGLERTRIAIATITGIELDFSHIGYMDALIRIQDGRAGRLPRARNHQTGKDEFEPIYRAAIILYTTGELTDEVAFQLGIEQTAHAVAQWRLTKDRAEKNLTFDEKQSTLQVAYDVFKRKIDTVISVAKRIVHSTRMVSRTWDQVSTVEIVNELGIIEQRVRVLGGDITPVQGNQRRGGKRPGRRRR